MDLFFFKWKLLDEHIISNSTEPRSLFLIFFPNGQRRQDNVTEFLGNLRVQFLAGAWL